MSGAWHLAPGARFHVLFAKRHVPCQHDCMGLIRGSFVLANPTRPEPVPVDVSALADTGAVHVCVPEHLVIQLNAPTSSCAAGAMRSGADACAGSGAGVLAVVMLGEVVLGEVVLEEGLPGEVVLSWRQISNGLFGG